MWAGMSLSKHPMTHRVDAVTESELKEVAVVGAAIVRDGTVLCAQRGAHGLLPMLWEFPGGKIEPGESARDALEREIHEELRCQVAVGPEVTTTVHAYDFATVSLTTFFCSLRDGEPELLEHAQTVWLPPEQLSSLQWAPADVPAVQIVAERLRQ